MRMWTLPYFTEFSVHSLLFPLFAFFRNCIDGLFDIGRRLCRCTSAKCVCFPVVSNATNHPFIVESHRTTHGSTECVRPSRTWLQITQSINNFATLIISQSNQLRFDCRSATQRLDGSVKSDILILDGNLLWNTEHVWQKQPNKTHTANKQHSDNTELLRTYVSHRLCFCYRAQIHNFTILQAVMARK